MKNKILIMTVALSISFILTNGHARKMSEGLKSQVERVKKYISEIYSVNDLKEEWSKDNTYIISYEYKSITKLRTKDNT